MDKQRVEQALKEILEVKGQEIVQNHGAFKAAVFDFLDEISIENQETVCEALSLFSETSLDFVDCVLIARHRILGDEVVSFDKKLSNRL